MSIKSILSSSVFTLVNMLPSEKDWQEKIDKVVDEYFNETIHLPRKEKKKRRKELNSDYSFFMAMKKYSLKHTFDFKNIFQ